MEKLENQLQKIEQDYIETYEHWKEMFAVKNDLLKQHNHNLTIKYNLKEEIKTIESKEIISYITSIFRFVLWGLLTLLVQSLVPSLMGPLLPVYILNAGIFIKKTITFFKQSNTKELREKLVKLESIDTICYDSLKDTWTDLSLIKSRLKEIKESYEEVEVKIGKYFPLIEEVIQISKNDTDILPKVEQQKKKELLNK